jgi:hypothetical protein
MIHTDDYDADDGDDDDIHVYTVDSEHCIIDMNTCVRFLIRSCFQLGIGPM